MATKAFYDGRNSGRLGASKGMNPFKIEDPNFEEWNRGYEEGAWLHRASNIELFYALKRLRNSLVKLDRLPPGFPSFWL